jgi:hydroxypyruvate isomerase
VATAIEYAKKLNVTNLHAMAGVLPQGITRTYARPTYIANLDFAATELAKHGMTLLIEAINTRDMPGFFLNTQAESYNIIEEIGASNLKMQMDLYHMQVMEGDLATKLSKYAQQCGHVQVAGVPKRNEPDTGEVNYAFLYDHLDEIGYTGWVGCEYRPGGETLDGLGWFKRLQS